LPSDSLRASNRPRLSLIAALARNRVIGRNNAMPWHLPEDLKRFKALTLGHPVIMGRKTWDSIVAALGKPLPGRTSVVISRSLQSVPPGALLARTLDEAIAACPASDEVFVIGGAEIYALALPFAARLYLTEIDAEPDGDTWFPEADWKAFKEISREPGAGATQSGWKFDFVTYERILR
jgi:dihydrofolate reductase